MTQIVEDKRQKSFKIGYIRVSTEEQNTARQEVLLKDCDRIFIDKKSGKNTDRTELKKLLDIVRPGDTVVVESYSRFARSTRDLLNLIDQLNNKKVTFISLKEQTDTSTPQGKLIMTIFAGLAEFEREQTLQRQREGIAIAKAEGRYKGRKPIQIDWAEFGKVFDRWKAGEITAVGAAKELGLKPKTYYRRVKEHEQGKTPI